MNEYFIVHKDGTIQPYATATHDYSEVKMLVSEEEVREQVRKNTQHSKRALEEIILRQV